jgi:glycerol-3-phosphate acyltransferase PlsY
VTWDRAWVAGWIAIILGFAFYEFWAGYGTGKHTPMLTQVVVRYVPWWVTLPFIVWLFIHFATRYANPNYIKWLKGF